MPLSSFFLWILLVFPPALIYHTPSPHSHPSLPTPIPELLVSISLWALSHLLSVPTFTAATTFLSPVPAQILYSVITVLLKNLLRISALPILGVQHHSGRRPIEFDTPAFARVWWVALGWSLAEVTVGISQGYEQLALYRDVLVTLARARELVILWTQPPPRGGSKGRGARDESGGSRTRDEPVRLGQAPPPLSRLPSEAEIRLEVDRDLDQLVALKTREELEELYGVPAIVSAFMSSDLIECVAHSRP